MANSFLRSSSRSSSPSLPLAFRWSGRGAPPETAPIAHLVDLTPASLLPRAVVVSHRLSTRDHKITRLRFTGSLREGLSDPPAQDGSVSATASVVPLPHGRVPPHNLDAERSLLGGILLDSEAFPEVVEIVRPEEFYRDGHRKVFEAMAALFGKG